MRKQKIIIGIFLIFCNVLCGCTMQSNSMRIEGTSMSHGDTPQKGIIDKNDIIIFEPITSYSEIITWGQGKSLNYQMFGDYGDVIVFHPDNKSGVSEIIHRAVCWVEVQFINGTRMYTIEELGIYNVTELLLPDLGINNNSILEWDYAGYLTKGDNNFIIDQLTAICEQPVKINWIEGKVFQLQDN